MNNHIKEYLKADDRNLAWLARKLGWNYYTLYYKVNGARNMTINDAKAISDVMGVRIEDLFF